MCMWGWGGGGGERSILSEFNGFQMKMPKSDNNDLSHLHLRILHLFTSNDIKEQNKTRKFTSSI